MSRPYTYLYATNSLRAEPDDRDGGLCRPLAAAGRDTIGVVVGGGGGGSNRSDRCDCTCDGRWSACDRGGINSDV